MNSKCYVSLDAEKPMIINYNILRFRLVSDYFDRVKDFIDIPLVKFSYRFVSDFASFRCLDCYFFIGFFIISIVYLNNVPSSNRVHYFSLLLNMPLGTIDRNTNSFAFDSIQQTFHTLMTRGVSFPCILVHARR